MGRTIAVTLRSVSVALLAAMALLATATAADEGDARRLAALNAALAPRLAASPFQRPLLIESTERGELARGEVYAVLPHPFARVSPALQWPSEWCRVLELHLNVKRCQSAHNAVTLYLGTKHAQALERATPLTLTFSADAGSDALKVVLLASSGPMGTRDYEFRFEAAPSGPTSTFIHFTYQVGTSTISRWAMQTYLFTLGRDKVGFSADPKDGRPGTIGGPRGAVERNAMRYALAIEVYLDSLALPESERTERRLQAWFDATERYARQLHEIDRPEYLAMKRQELSSSLRPTPP